MSPTVRLLVLFVAAVGFLFDTYELLMFPVIGREALRELIEPGATGVPSEEVVKQVRLWLGRTLWIAALAGGVFGLLGGWLIDRLGRKRVMVGSILLYSLSPVAAAFATTKEELILFRCTTFVGVCVELVAAVTWLAELFDDKRSRERAIGWTLAFASVGGILVTEVYGLIVQFRNQLPPLPVPERFDPHAAWRYTLLTGLVPGAIILATLPFVPESRVWLERKLAGTLKRPRFGELFAGGLGRTTIATTLISACGYAAAFGALQLTPSQIVAGVPEVKAALKEAQDERAAAKGRLDAAPAPEKDAAKAEFAAKSKAAADVVPAKTANIQRWQELGGLAGRILLALGLSVVPSRLLLRLFILPGVVLFPLTYLVLYQGAYAPFAVGVFCCGLLTVAQFSFIAEYLPRVFPVHLRGTGGSFATNVGGRMLGTMAATLNTEVLSQQFSGDAPTQVATAAAVIGGTVYVAALLASFALPKPADAAAEARKVD